MAAKSLGTLFLTIQGEFGKLNKQIQTFQNKSKKKGKDAGKSFGKSFRGGIGQLLSPQLIGAGAFGFALKGLVGLTAEFGKTMSEVRAISGATNAEFDLLNDKAKELGESTEFTGAQVGDGLVFLARAGLDAKESLEAIGPALDFATANNISLAKSADIATNVTSQFGKEVEDLESVMDVLTATAATSNTDILQLSEAMKFAGPTAAALGIPIEEMSAAIGILGNNGLQGSLATRALGTSLTRLAKPTSAMSDVMNKLGLDFFDAQGEFIGLNNTIGQLETGFVGLTDEQKQAALSTLFGAEAIQEMNILLNSGKDALNDYTTELGGMSGKTQELAAIMRDNLDGAVKELTSAFQGLVINLGEKLTPLLIGLFDGITGLIGIFQKYTLEIGLASLALGGLAIGFGLVTAPVAGLVGGLSLLAVAIGLVGSNSNDLVSETFPELNEQAKELNSNISNLSEQFKNGEIDIGEYNSELEKLTAQKFRLIQQTQFEEEANRELNGAYIEAQEQITKNNMALENLRSQYVKNIQDIELMTKRHGENSGFVKREIENNARLEGRMKALSIQTAFLAKTKKVLVATNQSVANSINNIKTANTVAEYNKLKKVSLELIEIRSTELQSLADIALANKDFVGFAKIKFQNAQLKVQLGLLKRIEFSGGKEVSGPIIIPTVPGDDTKSQAAAKENREIEKLAKESADEIERIEKELDKQSKQFFENKKKFAKDAYKSISDAVKESKKTIEDFDKEIQKTADSIKDIDKQISDIGTGTTDKLTSKLISVNQGISGISTGGAISGDDAIKLNELRKEQKQLEEALGREGTAEASRLSELTDTEKILEARDLELMQLEEKKIKLQEEKLVLETQKAAELVILKNFETEQIAIDKVITENFLTEVDIRKNAFDELISKAKEFNAVSGGLGISAEVGKVADQKFDRAGALTNIKNETNVNMGGVTTAQNGGDFAADLDRRLSGLRK